LVVVVSFYCSSSSCSSCSSSSSSFFFFFFFFFLFFSFFFPLSDDQISFRTMQSEYISDDAIQVLGDEVVGASQSAVLLRSLQRITFASRATQAATAGKHVSLGLEQYSRLTSPLRRYADFITHYQLKAYIRGWIAVIR
jgi:exoribonuclease R